MSNFAKLLSSVKIGDLELPNRMLMAPLTRCRATEELGGRKHTPNQLMAEYYAQRASAGLVIAEATMVQDKQSAFWTEPGIFDDACVEGWKLTTDAVHKAGGKIFLQIWHGGRACSSANGGVTPIAPSAIQNSHSIGAEFNPSGEKIDCDVPRALEDAEIPDIIKLFVDGAKRAMAAGFDGVEVHAANGYLLDEFLREKSNQRTGPYGGSLENRARLTVEVTQAVADAIGAGRVGVRLSPLNQYNDMSDSDPAGLTAYVAGKLNEIGIGYLHIMRGDFFSKSDIDVVTPARENFKGTLVSNMGYELDEANKDIEAGKIDAVAFGTKFLANPDLVERARTGAELNALDFPTFYARDAKGYTDYPTLAQKA